MLRVGWRAAFADAADNIIIKRQEVLKSTGQKLDLQVFFKKHCIENGNCQRLIYVQKSVNLRTVYCNRLLYETNVTFQKKSRIWDILTFFLIIVRNRNKFQADFPQSLCKCHYYKDTQIVPWKRKQKCIGMNKLVSKRLQVNR